MNKIVLKIAKKRNTIKLVQSKEELNKIIEERNKNILVKTKSFLEEELLEQSLIQHDEKKIKKDVDKHAELKSELELLEQELTKKNHIEDAPETSSHSYDLEKEVEQISKEVAPAFFDVSLKEILDNKNIEHDPLIKKKHAVYTEVYTISDNDKPIEISVERAEDDKISVEEASNQIQAAYQKGFDDCQEMAQINAQTKVSAAYKWVHRVDKLIVDLRRHYERQLKELQNKSLDWIMLISEIIIEQEVKQDNNIILTQIRNALKEVGEDTVFSIRVNPEMLAFLEQAKTKITTNYQNLLGTEILADATLGYSDCILTTSVGNIEARLVQQLEILKHEILDMEKENLLNTEVSPNIDTIPNVEPLTALEDDFDVI